MSSKAPAPFGLASATALIVANMIGTGVFTSLGFQVAGTKSGFALLALWAVGGLLSLAGALCYAELGAMLPRSGGEYVYLSRAWSPTLGFVGGFVSITAGFAVGTGIVAHPVMSIVPLRNRRCVEMR
ncbi:MAG: amino acid permease [Proteobacteria bacterium]|nr:amino acid permease [Pseudomonadota bacterium]